MSNKYPILRNALGDAYGAADGLYENALALSLFLDAWSKRHVTPRLNESAAQHVRHNLVNAQSNLTALRQALAEALDAMPTGDQPWPANADCDEEPVRGSYVIQTESAPGGLSGFSGGAGGLL